MDNLSQGAKVLNISHSCLDRTDRKDDMTYPHYRVGQLWRIRTKLCAPANLHVSTRRAFLSPSEQWTVYQNFVSARLLVVFSIVSLLST